MGWIREEVVIQKWAARQLLPIQENYCTSIATTIVYISCQNTMYHISFCRMCVCVCEWSFVNEKMYILGKVNIRLKSRRVA